MNAQRGYLLISVIVTLFILAAVTLMMSEESVMESRMIHSETEKSQLRYLTEAAMQHAEWSLQQQGCGPFSDLSSTAFGKHSYSATFSPNEPPGIWTTYNNLPVDQDTWLKQSAPSELHGADVELSVKNVAADSMQALYRFDLSTVPAGSHIESAIVTLYVSGNDPLGAISIHPVTADWNEATADWTSMATQFDPVQLASIPPQSSSGVTVQVNLTAQVQAWMNGTMPNYGIMLVASATGNESKLASKEWSTTTQRPRLDVVTTTATPPNRADITASSVLVSGITHSLQHRNIPLYQNPASSLTLQPDGAVGKDNRLYEWKSSWNYGADTSLVVDDVFPDSTSISLMQFPLEGIPAGARIISATLALHQNFSNNTGGPIGVHRVADSWIEGAMTGQAGASNWTERESGVTWATAGGDFDAAPISETTLTAKTIGWVEWDIAALVQGWVDETYANNGLALVAESIGAAGYFDSSDATNPALRPKLTISYSCECGIVCQAPAGSGKIILVGNWAGNHPDPADLEKAAIFESWGYQVDQVDDDFLWLVDFNYYDLVYISQTTSSSAVIGQLSWRSIGIVNEQGDLNFDLLFSSGSATLVDDSIDIIDNSHYVTAPFALGELRIYDAPMELITAAGSKASGMQTLASAVGVESLMLLEAGATGVNGSAAGRRVNLPLGRAVNFNWKYLNNNGRLLVQRALQWAIESAPPIPAKKIYWTDDNGAMIQRSNEDGSNVETVVVNQPKVRGLDIDTVNGKIYWTSGKKILRADLTGSNVEDIYAAVTESNFDIKLDTVGGKMYWSTENPDNQIMRANLDGTAVETVSSSVNRPMYISLDRANNQLYATAFGSGDIVRMNFDGSALTTIMNGVDNGIIGSAIDLKNGKVYWSGGISNDWIRRANLDGSNVETILTGLSAPQDIAVDEDHGRIYFTDALGTPSIKRANLDGTGLETIVSGLDRPRGILVVNAEQTPAVQPLICNGTYFDQFNNRVLDGSDGTIDWSTSAWAEVGESDGVTKGDIQIRNDISNYQLQIKDNNNGGEGMQRAVNLNGASIARLRFKYRRKSLDNAADYVSVYISSNGTAGPWVELDRIGTTNDSVYKSYSRDISSYISPDTVIRLLSSPDLGDKDVVWFDDIEVQCIP